MELSFKFSIGLIHYFSGEREVCFFLGFWFVCFLGLVVFECFLLFFVVFGLLKMCASCRML